MATIGTRQGEQCIPSERTTVSAIATASGAMVLDSKNRAFLVENGLFSQKIYHSITKSAIKYLSVWQPVKWLSDRLTDFSRKQFLMYFPIELTGGCLLWTWRTSHARLKSCCATDIPSASRIWGCYAWASIRRARRQSVSSMQERPSRMSTWTCCPTRKSRTSYRRWSSRRCIILRRLRNEHEGCFSLLHLGPFVGQGAFIQKNSNKFGFSFGLHYLWPSAEGTLARKFSNKFGISLTYSYLCRRDSYIE